MFRCLAMEGRDDFQILSAFTKSACHTQGVYRSREFPKANHAQSSHLPLFTGTSLKNYYSLRK